MCSAVVITSLWKEPDMENPCRTQKKTIFFTNTLFFFLLRWNRNWILIFMTLKLNFSGNSELEKIYSLCNDEPLPIFSIKKNKKQFPRRIFFPVHAKLRINSKIQADGWLKFNDSISMPAMSVSLLAVMGDVVGWDSNSRQFIAVESSVMSSITFSVVRLRTKKQGVNSVIRKV